MRDTVGSGREGPALDDYVDAVADLYERGKTDGLNGGVAPDAVAEELGVTAGTVRNKLLILRKQDRIEAVWGVGPDRPRKGFRPTDESGE